MQFFRPAILVVGIAGWKIHAQHFETQVLQV